MANANLDIVVKVIDMASNEDEDVSWIA